ncbi:hypothetical protein PFICI_01794 [Pestalotiopsis fici W106-1]|uniref:N-acetyltransferase domain-containing protein n=1 Tax=Pestalotiopsis fici (strain W106-1 / CGMCC3.15140) TaxID=1229662 RepID=W3XRT9_PESFW|nr:uncharacterized protein PFICI_01794 [Pestalotiopsis fici W106-1]ETS87966.1 hypothetical protein PFICI_01794 [Pestalotiopsis fici W106-1]
MPLVVQPATEADVPRAVEIEAAAYGPNQFTPILFPGPMPANALEERAAFFVKGLREDPTTRWHKVVDTDLDGQEQTVAVVKWHIFTEKPQFTPRAAVQGCNLEACDLVFGGLQRQRARILGDTSYRRGAATLLIQIVLEEAQKRGMIAYLESSEAGHSLYKGQGFEDIEMHEVDLSKWGATDTHKTWAMMWKPTKNS